MPPPLRFLAVSMFWKTSTACRGLSARRNGCRTSTSSICSTAWRSRASCRSPSPTLARRSARSRQTRCISIGITNYLGCSLWNSYTNTYTAASFNGLTVVASDLLSMTLTNSDPNFTPIGFNNYQVVSSNLPSFNTWTGTVWSASPPDLGVDSVWLVCRAIQRSGRAADQFHLPLRRLQRKRAIF